MNEKASQTPWFLINVFVLLVIGISLSGFFYYLDEKKDIIEKQKKELVLIAQSKVDQIVRWRQERLDDGEILFKNPFMSHRIKRFLNNPRSFDIEQEILSWMASLLRIRDYSNVFLLDSEGRVKLIGGNEDEPLGHPIQAKAEEVIKKKEVLLTDLIQDETDHNIHMDLLVPILLYDEPESRTVGLVVVRIDPYQYLYPLLQSWPTSSQTSESLLLRREGEALLCLNVLRHQKQTALTLRLPFQTPGHLGTTAIPNNEGLFEFVDYRSKPVLGSIHKIPSSSWTLLSKIDSDEIFMAVHEKSGTIIVLVCLLVVVAGTSIGLYWRHQRAFFYRQKYENELERDQVQKALLEKELRYRTLFDIAQEGIFIISGETIRDCNSAAEHLLASSRPDILGKNFFQFSPQVQPDGRLSIDIGAEIVQKVITQGPQRVEWVHQTPDGNRLDVEVSVSQFYMEGESYLLVLEWDITQRKRAEKAMRDSEANYRAIFDAAHDAIFVHDMESGAILDLNQKGCEMYGYTVEEARGFKGGELSAGISPYTREEGLRWFKAAIQGEAQLFEWLAQDKLGRHFPVEVSLKRAVIGGQGRLLAVVRDITERKRAEEERLRLEERLQRSEKMEALGTLAGGVAHDLNNVLGVLVGYSQLLMFDAPEGSALRDHAFNIFQAGQRATAIIQDLLTLARRGVAISKILNLNQIISDFLKTPELDKLKSHHPLVTIRMELASDLLNIKGSPLHLYKTVMNLLSNGVEAVSGPGEVLIRTENRYIDKPIPGYEETREGEYALLTVSDTGTGIPQSDLRRIFEPFYTKKVMGRSGTGLGLAVVWGTVKDHNGYIDVQSEEGKGSTFTLYFPVTREGLTEEREALPRSDYLGQGETLLVVDDVKEQRSLAATMLGSLGYLVHTLASGEEAMEYLKVHQVDLLVLDMIMEPGMDGLETYQRILEIRPEQRAIIVSGFSETDRVRRAQALGAGAYVRKPYILEKIGLAVRQELDGRYKV
jgi:PAS domain S-box-containing protein